MFLFFVIKDYSAKRAREAHKHGRDDKVVSLAEACNDVLFLFCCKYPQYFVFPKENKDGACLSVLVVWPMGKSDSCFMTQRS